MTTNQSSMQGKVCLVTGATQGIGEVTARELARMGAEVVVLSRNPERCAAAVKRIQRESGNPAVSFIAAELSAQAEVRRAAVEFLEKHDRLDVLVNNAGAWFMRRQFSVDGIEMTWALNHLSNFLLSHLLMDALQNSPAARIINVSSGAHFGGRIHFDDLQLQRWYEGFRAYSQSKLANVLFTYELARRQNRHTITANVLHPGFVASGFGKNNGWLMTLFMRISGIFARTAEQGAQTSIYLASAQEVEGITGRYFFDSKAATSSPDSYDLKIARRLWEISVEMTGLRE